MTPREAARLIGNAHRRWMDEAKALSAIVEEQGEEMRAVLQALHCCECGIAEVESSLIAYRDERDAPKPAPIVRVHAAHDALAREILIGDWMRATEAGEIMLAPSLELVLVRRVETMPDPEQGVDRLKLHVDRGYAGTSPAPIEAGATLKGVGKKGPDGPPKVEPEEGWASLHGSNPNV